jgi:hypothetical protein
LKLHVLRGIETDLDIVDEVEDITLVLGAVELLEQGHEADNEVRAIDKKFLFGSGQVVD